MTMIVHIELAANLKQTIGKRVFEFELEDDSTVDSMLERLQYSELDKKYILVSINGKMAKIYDEVKNGDKVFLSVLVGGG